MDKMIVKFNHIVSVCYWLHTISPKMHHGECVPRFVTGLSSLMPLYGN